MPRYHLYATQLVTAGFDVEAATPEAAVETLLGDGYERYTNVFMFVDKFTGRKTVEIKVYEPPPLNQHQRIFSTPGIVSQTRSPRIVVRLRLGKKFSCR